MAIDIEIIRMLPPQEVNKTVIDLETRLEESKKELHIIESKLRKAIQDDSSKPSDIGILVSYRDEVKQVIHQIKSDLKIIEIFLGGSIPDVATSTAESISGSGTVYFRNVNENTRKIPGIKDYEQIQKDLCKDEEHTEIRILAEKLKKAQEYLKIEESKKTSQNQRQQSSTTKI